MNVDLIKKILLISTASSIISTAIIQKIKEQLISKKILFFVSFFVSMFFGFFFSISFSKLSILDSLWVGVITWVGADTIYKSFEDKIFKSYNKLESSSTINIIREEDDG